MPLIRTVPRDFNLYIGDLTLSFQIKEIINDKVRYEWTANRIVTFKNIRSVLTVFYKQDKIVLYGSKRRGRMTVSIDADKRHKIIIKNDIH